MSDTANRLIAWYGAHARALPWRVPPGAALPDDADFPYRVWLSEIMLQQTTVAAVRPYFADFTARWPNVAALAAADDGDVMQAWAGLGYYARARNLLACARAVTQRFGGVFPCDEAILRTLPGIGDYTAAAIAAFAFGRQAIVIDGNIERVITRHAGITAPLPGARADIRAAIAAMAPAHAGDFAQGVMDLAGRICTPRSPDCSACPIAGGCAARALGTPQAFPVKPAKRARPERRGTIWWIECGGAVLTVIRPAKGLLGGMRALPSCNWSGDALPPFAADWQDWGAVSHGFTHFELTLAVAATMLPTRPDLPGEWVMMEKLLDSGLPTVFRKAAVRALAARMETV